MASYSGKLRVGKRVAEKQALDCSKKVASSDYVLFNSWTGAFSIWANFNHAVRAELPKGPEKLPLSDE